MPCRVSPSSLYHDFDLLDTLILNYSIAPWLSWWTNASQKNPNINLGKWMGVYAAFGILSLCFLGLGGA
jgi:hypothetical protein